MKSLFACFLLISLSSAIVFGQHRGDDSARPKNQQSKEVEVALKYLGAPYRLGGNDIKRGMDCAHFVAYVYHEAGMRTLEPPVHSEEAVGKVVQSQSPRIERGGQWVSVKSEPGNFAALSPGDRLIFQIKAGSNEVGNHETGIYVGEYHKMKHAFILASKNTHAIGVFSLEDFLKTYRYALRD